MVISDRRIYSKRNKIMIHKAFFLTIPALMIAVTLPEPVSARVYCTAPGVPVGCVARPAAVVTPGVGAPGVGVRPGVGVGAPGVGVRGSRWAGQPWWSRQPARGALSYPGGVFIPPFVNPPFEKNPCPSPACGRGVLVPPLNRPVRFSPP